MKKPAPAPPTQPPKPALPPTEPSILALPAPAPSPGRPTIQTPEVVQAICATIRLHGLSDSAAGLLAGVSTSTLSRWKQEDEDFQVWIGQARVQFDLGLLTDIRKARKRDGTPDWRAQAWLLQKSSPETYGPPSRHKRLPAVTPPASPDAVSPDALAQLQAARLAAHPIEPAPAAASAALDANCAKIPEMPAPAAGEPGPTEPVSPPPHVIAIPMAPGENVPKIPKTPAAEKLAKIPETRAKPSLLKSALAKVAAKLHPTGAPAAPDAAAQKLAAAQRLAREAEEFRRIHEAMEREWERQTNEPSDEWMKDVIPGMWAG